MTSDRWWAYNHLPVKRRPVCWSHLQRDFAAHAEGLAAEKERRRMFGLLIAAANELFHSGPFGDGLAFAEAADRLADSRADHAS